MDKNSIAQKFQLILLWRDKPTEVPQCHFRSYYIVRMASRDAEKSEGKKLHIYTEEPVGLLDRL